MKPVILTVVLALVPTSSLLWPPAATEQVFRAERDAVLVDVSALDRGRPIGGLAAEDFRLEDNGIPQSVTLLSVAEVPIDLTLLVDVSYSIEQPTMGAGQVLKREPAGAWITHGTTVVAGQLGPRDRLQVLRFASDIDRLAITGGRLELPAVDAVTLMARTSFFDALAVAGLQPHRSGAHHAVVALTDALDTSSLVPYEVLVQMLARSDAAVHVVTAGPREFADSSLRTEMRETAFRPRSGQDDQPLQSMSVPFGDDYDWLLRDLVDRTGGRLTISRNGDDFVDALRTSLEHIRARYLLSYSPEGVAREGWHEVKVTVPNHPKYEVRARRGYWRRDSRLRLDRPRPLTRDRLPGTTSR
jgi:VWFA-related protein